MLTSSVTIGGVFIATMYLNASPLSEKPVKFPHCGCEISQKRKGVKKPRRRRLPNGFGSITEIKGRRLSKPFYVRVTTGRNIKGQIIMKPLKPTAYFKTYNEAYKALAKYYAEARKK